MRRVAVVLVCAAAFCLGGCTTYQQDLDRAELHYTQNEYERALALFRVIELDIDSLNHVDQIRYCYLRGMNDYRLGPTYRPDARHWLALARSLDEQQAGGLKPEWKDRLEAALKDLNGEVYGISVPTDEGSEAAKSDNKASDKSTDSKSDSKSDSQDDKSSKPKKCNVDNDCPGSLVCIKSFCKKP